MRTTTGSAPPMPSSTRPRCTTCTHGRSSRVRRQIPVRRLLGDLLGIEPAHPGLCSASSRRRSVVLPLPGSPPITTRTGRRRLAAVPGGRLSPPVAVETPPGLTGAAVAPVVAVHPLGDARLEVGQSLVGLACVSRPSSTACAMRSCCACTSASTRVSTSTPWASATSAREVPSGSSASEARPRSGRGRRPRSPGRSGRPRGGRRGRDLPRSASWLPRRPAPAVREPSSTSPDRASLIRSTTEDSASVSASAGTATATPPRARTPAVVAMISFLRTATPRSGPVLRPSAESRGGPCDGPVKSPRAFLWITVGAVRPKFSRDPARSQVTPSRWSVWTAPTRSIDPLVVRAEGDPPAPRRAVGPARRRRCRGGGADPDTGRNGVGLGVADRRTPLVRRWPGLRRDGRAARRQPRPARRPGRPRGAPVAVAPAARRLAGVALAVEPASRCFSSCSPSAVSCHRWTPAQYRRRRRGRSARRARPPWWRRVRPGPLDTRQ